MKTLFISILFLLFSNILVQAQFIQGYGIKGGVSFANQDPSSGNEVFEYKTGLDLGVYIEVLDLPYINILTELHYLQKGRKGKNINEDVSIDYLSIPINAKIFIKQTSVTPYLIIGPRIDIMVSNDYYVPDIIVGGETGQYEFEDVVFGANVGLGLETKVLKPIALLVEFRYSPDFTYATKLPYKFKNKSFGILVGVGL